MDEELAPTLQALVDSSLKWIFVGGKGGVGKTTTSCSVAIQMAKTRKNVLIISTDPAHNLSDAFQQKEVDPKPQKLEMEGLSESDGGFLAEITAAIPGIDEAMSFAEVMKLIQSLEYDTVVFDTAPTGHTLRLLQFPDTLQRALGKLEQLQGTLGPMMSAMGPMLGAGADTGGLFSQLSVLQKTVTEVKNQFQDANLTTFVCVCIPEFLSLYETERLVQELTKQDIDVHNIVVNQVIFKGPKDFSVLLDARIRMQTKYLNQYDELYGEDMHLLKLPLLEEEVRGVKNLEKFSKWLLQPYNGEGGPTMDPFKRIEELEQEVAKLRKQAGAT